jgi:hypothetical protein
MTLVFTTETPSSDEINIKLAELRQERMSLQAQLDLQIVTIAPVPNDGDDAEVNDAARIFVRIKAAEQAIVELETELHEAKRRSARVEICGASWTDCGTIEQSQPNRAGIGRTYSVHKRAATSRETSTRNCR